MTDEEWGLIRHFKKKEFLCLHCSTEQMDFNFVRRLDDARDQFGQAIRISSGYRCVDHNLAVGGSATSSHLKGKAVDVLDRKDPLYRAILFLALHRAGFMQFEVSRDGHIHVMSDEGKPSPFLGIEP